MDINDQPDWALLKNFHIASECKNFKSAAEKIRVTPITLKRQMVELEKSIGKDLFNRSSKDYMFTTLTLAGEDLKRKTTSIKKLISQTESKTRTTVATDENKELRIYTTQGICSSVLPEILSSFSRKYPNISIVIDTTSVPKKVSPGEIQIRRDFRPQKDLVKVELMSFKNAFYASSSYIEKMGNPKNFDELENHRVLFSLSSLDSKYNFTETYFIKPYILCSNFNLSLFLCQDGAGILCIPEIVMKKTNLRKVLQEEKVPEEKIYIGFSSSGGKDLSVENFILTAKDIVKEAF